MKSTKPKRHYISPDISISWIEMEEGIAASSATVVPTDNSGTTIKEEWEVLPDHTRDLNF